MTEETKTIDQSKLIDHMKYLPGMEVIDSDMLDQVVAIHDSFNNDDFTEKDVRLALSKEHLDPRDFMALLSTAAAPFLEEMAQKAHLVTRRHFGNNIWRVSSDKSPHLIPNKVRESITIHPFM